MTKRELLSSFVDRLDLNGLSKTRLLSDSDCFGILYGAGACRRCTHKVKLGGQYYPLNRVCAAVQQALVDVLDSPDDNLDSLLKRVKSLIKVSKIKKERPIKKAIAAGKSKRNLMALKAVKTYAKRKHNELDWAGKIYDISARYGVEPVEIVNQFSEVIRKSCNASVLHDLLAFAEKS
ncbi:MAG TPA: hypothetical protein ENK98_02250 [Epsilonproteobacteria bacterium]|nr:hypothetical protein [Campylobacterota bacterium]